MNYEKIFNNIINKVAVISVTTEKETYKDGDYNLISCVNIVVTLIGNQNIVVNKLSPIKPLPSFTSDYRGLKRGMKNGREGWIPAFDYDCAEVANEFKERVEAELNRILQVLNVD